MTRTFLTLLVFSVPLSAAPVPKAVKKGVDLDGVWTMSELYSGEKNATGRNAARWTITGEQVGYEHSNDGEPFRRPDDATYSLVRPKGGGADEFDYVVTYKTGRVATYPGRVEVDGDTFKLCYGVTTAKLRPTECQPKVGTVMFVFKRADPK
jgi:hypothetical protein